MILDDFKKRLETQYFICPKGRVVKYKGDLDVMDITSVHYEIAASIYPDHLRPQDRLMREGWILVGSSVYYVPIIHKDPTQKQIDTLFELGLLERLEILTHGGHYEKYEL